MEVCMKQKLSFFILTTLVIGISCSRDDAENTADTLLSGGTTLEKANEIQFISDISWLKDYFSNLDQASIPWIWGTVLFTQEVGGVSGVPVIFDAENPPEIKVDLKIQAAGSAKLANRTPVTVFEKNDVILKLMNITAFVSLGDETTSYTKVPDNIPLVGGKTVYPMYFISTIDEYAWSDSQSGTKTAFQDALKNGDLTNVISTASSDVPVPWFDCETVKISMKYKGNATEEGKYQIESTKYLAADPKVVIKLLGQLADGAGPVITEQTGYDISKIKTALESLTVPDCEAPDEADIALFD